MKLNLKVLIIEDHPLISEAYINVLNHFVSAKGAQVTIDNATTCDEALLCLCKASKPDFYDLVLLDIRLPSQNTRFLCGEDLGMEIRAISEHTKIIVSTSYNDNFRLNNILKTIDPDGFLIKADVDSKIIFQAIETVFNDPPFYSHSIIKLLRKQMSNEIILDTIDRQLLFQISIGTKTKDLPKILPLSIAGIERRKRRLKRELNANNKDDFNLIKIAKEKGFIS